MTAPDSFRSRSFLLALLEQLAAVLAIKERLNGENVLIREEHFSHASTGEQTKHPARFLLPFRFHRLIL